MKKNEDESFDFVIGDLEIVHQKKPKKDVEKWTNQKRINSKNVIGEKFLLKTKTESYEIEVIKDGYCKIKKVEEKITEKLKYIKLFEEYKNEEFSKHDVGDKAKFEVYSHFILNMRMDLHLQKLKNMLTKLVTIIAKDQFGYIISVAGLELDSVTDKFLID